MPHHSWSRFVLLASALMLTPAACASARPAHVREERQEDDPALVGLRKRVEAFAVGLGDEEVFARFKQLPRDELIASLSRLRDESLDDDPLRVKIAFLMCRLGYNYDENRDTVAGSVSRPPRYYQLAPDETIGFVEDLLKRGDKTLLPVVIAVNEWADGAVGEAVSGILYDEATRDVGPLLRSLLNTSAPTREAVYRQLGYLLRHNEEAKKKLLRQLRAKSRDKDLRPLAQEMARSIE